MKLSNRVATRSGKTKKKTKVRKKWGFLKTKSGNLTKLEKTSDYVSLNLQNFLFSKAFKW